MGIGCVLVVWLVLGTAGAVLGSLVFGTLTSRRLRSSPTRPRRRAVIAATAFPPVALILGFAGFIGYAIWCEAVRGVDAGIGDFAQVPLGSGYKLQMIDTPQNAFIRTPGGDEIEIGSRPFGFDDKFIYVETNPGRFSLIDKAAGHALGELDAPDLDRKLHQVGVKKGAIRSAWATYTDLRWSVVDLLAAIAILVLPVLVGVTVLLYVFRVRRMIGNGA